jgi:hypothetical protein
MVTDAGAVVGARLLLRGGDDARGEGREGVILAAGDLGLDEERAATGGLDGDLERLSHGRDDERALLGGHGDLDGGAVDVLDAALVVAAAFGRFDGEIAGLADAE